MITSQGPPVMDCQVLEKFRPDQTKRGFVRVASIHRAEVAGGRRWPAVSFFKMFPDLVRPCDVQSRRAFCGAAKLKVSRKPMPADVPFQLLHSSKALFVSMQLSANNLALLT